MSWGLSPEHADWWYVVSWKGIIWSLAATAVAAVAAGIFTMLQFWSDGVRDERAKDRQKTLELQTAEAQARADGSRAMAADAQKGAALLRARAAEAELKLEELRNKMAPRRLSSEEQARVAAAISKFSGQKFETGVYVDDQEARGIWADISSALQSAGWELTAHGSFMGGLIVGVEVSIAGSRTGTDVQFAAQALVEALLAEQINTHITIEHASQEARPDVIQVNVGQKPM